MSSKIFFAEMTGYQIQVDLQIIGSDVLLVITGGDSPHLGTVTTFSTEGEQQTVQFPSHSGRQHKDHVLAEIMLAHIQPVLVGNCVITAGVHVDHISQEQIIAASAMTADLGQQVCQWLKAHPIMITPPSYYGDLQQPD